MIELVYDEMKENMRGAVDHLKKEFAGVRTGRASTALLDGITMDYYGVQTPLNQMATLSVPDSNLITIQPWDGSALQNIEKAVLKSGLGLTPSNDGNIIRIPIPPLSGERRQELVKHVRKMVEDARIAIRNIRRTGNEELKKLEKGNDITEDENHKGHDKVQKITDEFIKKLDDVLAAKEKEILEH